MHDTCSMYRHGGELLISHIFVGSNHSKNHVFIVITVSYILVATCVPFKFIHLKYHILYQKIAGLLQALLEWPIIVLQLEKKCMQIHICGCT